MTPDFTLKVNMGARRRKIPVTSSESLTHHASSSSSTSRCPGSNLKHGTSANPHISARVIRRFHVLLKRKAQLEKQLSTLPFSDRRRRGTGDNEVIYEDQLRRVESEIEEMGGLGAYQRMSTIGQGKDRGGGSESVFITWLVELSVRDEFENIGKGKGKATGSNKLRYVISLVVSTIES